MEDKEYVDEFKERLNNAREFNWEGGFKQVFLEDWLANTLKAVREDERERTANLCKQKIDLYSQGTGNTPLALGGKSYSDHLATGKIEAYDDILKALTPPNN